MLNLIKKELYLLFLSPLAWVMMAVTQVILCYLFLIHLQDFLTLQPQLKLLENAPGVTEYMIPRLYSPAASIYMLLMPLLTMRLLADEYKQKTIVLLFASSLSNTSIVLAKYLSLLLTLLIMLLLNSLMLLTLTWYVPLDFISLVWALMGTFLFLSACGAAGLYFSSITQQPATAAFATFGFLFLIWILGLSGGSQQATSEVMKYLALSHHLDSFILGILSVQDIIYYLLFIALFLSLTVYRLATSRSV
jgi:ABC-2 type transport system permease protein